MQHHQRGARALLLPVAQLLLQCLLVRRVEVIARFIQQQQRCILRQHHRQRHALTFATGMLDAVGYLGLDRVFTGNMTGNVVILAMALTGADGLPVVGPLLAPLFVLPGKPGQPLPYLGYAPGAYLGRVTELILKQSGTPIHLDRVYETDMAEGLKAMALEGQGVAFLPYSAVKKELKARRLVSAVPPGATELQMVMDVRAYREKPSGKETAKGTAQALWEYLQVQAGAGLV